MTLPVHQESPISLSVGGVLEQEIVTMAETLGSDVKVPKLADVVIIV